MLTRSDMRSVAIVAHVDHGKTTLVDDASERPLPQTRFVLRNPLALARQRRSEHRKAPLASGLVSRHA